MIHDMETFLTYVLRLESEAIEGFERLARTMDGRADGVTRLFHMLADFSRQHLEEIENFALSDAGRVPDYESAELEWPDGFSPENPISQWSGEPLDPGSALELGMKMELRAADFYRGIADRSQDARVRELAQDQSEEEAMHAEMLERWYAEYR